MFYIEIELYMSEINLPIGERHGNFPEWKSKRLG